jgi:glycine cleavage system H protein
LGHLIFEHCFGFRYSDFGFSQGTMTPISGQGDDWMKNLDELILPEDVRYAEDHEWARSEGGVIRCGISDYAQAQMGDIVYVELPGVGDTFSRGDPFGTVESVKAVVELYMPVGGEVVAVNGE